MNPADIVQNDAIGAVLLAEAIASFCQRDCNGMPLVLGCTILPLVFHRSSSQQILGRQGKGAFFRLARETPRISAGLEDRMQAMLQQTFDGMNLALASESVKLIPETACLFAGQFSYPRKFTNLEVGMKLRAARRLGDWYSLVGTPQVCALLNIRM